MAHTLIALGGLLFLGLLADLLGTRTPLPRVTILLLAGILLGPYALDVLPESATDLFPVLTSIALGMIGFLLGGRFTRTHFGSIGVISVVLSLSVALTTAVIVFVALYFLGVPVPVALVIAGIAPATDPAATIDIVNERKAGGPVTDILIGIVALDDAWGILIFNACLAVAVALLGDLSAGQIITSGVREFIGSIILGVALGVPVAYLTGRLREGEPIQAEALGAVLLVAGLAEHWSLSPILSSMVMGCVVANLATHHSRPFHAIEGIEWPFLMLFFLFAGSALELNALRHELVLLAVYVIARCAGRLAGIPIGSVFFTTKKAGLNSLNSLGVALMPQAGVAIGLSLYAGQAMPQFQSIILPLILASSILFELVGPILTRRYLQSAGEIPSKDTGSRSGQ